MSPIAEPRTSVRTLIAVLSVLGMLVVSQLYVTIPLFPLFAKLLGISSAAASFAGSGFGFAYAAGFLVFGPLSDRVGRRAVLAPGLFALAITTCAVGFSGSFFVLILLRAIQGFTAATFAPAALAYLGEALPPPKRPTAIAFVSTGFLTAGIVGQLYSSSVSAAYGWRWVFFSLAAVYAAGALLLWLTLSPRLAQVAPTTSFLAGYRRMLALLGRPALVQIYAAALVVLLSFVAMYSALGPHLNLHYHVSASQMFSLRVAGIPGMLIALLAGRFIQRWGCQAVVTAGLSVAATGLLLEALAGSLLPLVMASVLFIAGIAVTVPALIALVGNTAGADSRGAAVALYTFVLFVGASLGPLVATALRPIGFGPSLACLAGVLLCAAALVRGIQLTGVIAVPAPAKMTAN